MYFPSTVVPVRAPYTPTATAEIRPMVVAIFSLSDRYDVTPSPITLPASRTLSRAVMRSCSARSTAKGICVENNEYEVHCGLLSQMRNCECSYLQLATQQVSPATLLSAPRHECSAQKYVGEELA